MGEVTEMFLAVPYPEPAQQAMEQAALAAGRGGELARNPALSESAWFALRPERQPLANAVALAARPLSEAQRRHLLEREKRSKVLIAMARDNHFDVDEQQLLAAKAEASSQLADELLSGSKLSPDVARPLALAVKGKALLAWLADADVDTIADAEVRALLDSFASWAPGPSGHRSRLLRRLLERRPALIAAVTTPGQDLAVLDAAAGSQFLVDPTHQRAVARFEVDGHDKVVAGGDYLYTYRAFIHNPVVAPELLRELAAWASPRSGASAFFAEIVETVDARLRAHPRSVTEGFDQVADPELLRWIVMRSLPSERFNRPARPYALATLARNANLGDLAAHVARELGTSVRHAVDDATYRSIVGTFNANYPDWAVPALAQHPAEPGTASDTSERDGEWIETVVVSQVAWMLAPLPASVGCHLASKLGAEPKAWELLVGLADTFDGTVGELVEVCRLL